MKHFGMTAMDDSPTINKPPPPTATRAVKKQWLFKVAETIVMNYIVEDADRFNPLIGKDIFQNIDWLFSQTHYKKLSLDKSCSFIFLPSNLCNHTVDT